MTKLVVGVVVVVSALGAAACLVPSFDGMKSDGSEADGDETAQVDGGKKAAGVDGGAASSSTNGSNGNVTTDAASGAGPRTFLCRASDNMRCKLGAEACCFKFGVPSTWSCVAKGATAGCTGTTQCGENADCAAGETCCFDGVSTGVCSSSCQGALAYRACDRSKPGTTCDNGKACVPPGGSSTVPDHCE